MLVYISIEQFSPQHFQYLQWSLMFGVWFLFGCFFVVCFLGFGWLGFFVFVVVLGFLFFFNRLWLDSLFLFLAILA